MTSTQQVLLHLSLIKGAGPGLAQRLIAAVGIAALDTLYSFSATNLVSCGLTQAQAELVHLGLQDRAVLERELTLCAQHAITVVTIIDTDYPLLLKEIHLPPVVLYYRGVLPIEGDLLAVVGARKATGYAQNVVEQLLPPLIDHGFTIVSGGALGADTMAHATTVKAGGKTIAVLGSGLLVPYPVQNKKLFEAMIEHGGGVVSSFPLEESAFPGNFPARNRIIAGLARGCLVVQAAQKSGALITASYALEQNRDVFAIPGPITDELSAGCNKLIQQGAKLVMHAEDILQEYGYAVTPAVQATVTVDGLQPVVPHQETVQDDSLPARMLRFAKSPVSVDELAQTCALDLMQVQDLLFDLQLQGKVVQTIQGLWLAV